MAETKITNNEVGAAANIAISKTTLGTFTDWTAFTPTITCGASTAPTYTSASSSYRYMQIGKKVTAAYFFENTVGGTAGNGADYLRISLPVNSTFTTSAAPLIGSGMYLNGATVIGTWVMLNTAGTVLMTNSTGTNVTANDQNNVTRRMRLLVNYEVA